MTGNEALVSLLIAFAFTLWLGAGIKLVLDKLKDIEWELKKLNQTPPTFGQYPKKDIKAVLDDSMTWRVDE